MHRILATAWLEIHSNLTEADTAAAVSNLNAEQVAAAPADDSHDAVKKARIAKSCRLFKNWRTPSNLAITCIFFRPALNTMGYIFRKAKLGTDKRSVSSFCSMSSPVLVTISRYLQMSSELGADYWAPLLEKSAWTCRKLQLVFNSICRVVCSLFLKNVYPYWQWPFRLARFDEDDLSDEAAESLAEEIEHGCEDCLDKGLTARLKKKYPTKDRIRCRDCKEQISDTFERAPLSNVLTEDRLARSGVGKRCQQGHLGLETTMMCKHTLSEFKSMHAIALQRCLR